MNTVLELKENRAKIVAAMRTLLDTQVDKNGVLSAEDDATYNKMEADVVALDKEIARNERLQEVENSLKQATTVPIMSDPKQEVKGTKSDLYTQAFWAGLKLKKGGSLPVEIYNSLNEGTDADGGYLVPDEYDRTLIEGLEEENIFRRLAHVIQTQYGDHKIPVVASKGTASWIDEEAAYPESDDTFAQVTLGAYKLATLIKVSEELLNDSVFNLPSYIAKEFARRIGRAEEQAFIAGDGTGKPTGVITSAQVGVTSASATAITMDEVLDLFYSLKAPYRSKASFITNDTTIKAIRKLKDSNGQYLWQPSVQAGQPDMLLNKPIHTSTYMPAIASGAKVLTFGDYGYYWIADRQGRSFRQLNEIYAPTGQVGFRASERVDGKLILPEAVQVLQMGA